MNYKQHLPDWEDEERAKVAFDKIWDDLADMPLVRETEVDLVVDSGHFTWNTIQQPWRLSETQEEILFALSRGKTPSQIAEARNITNKTVATQLRRIRVRLRCKTNEEAVAVGIGSGIIPAINRDPKQGDRMNIKGLPSFLGKTLLLMAEGNTNEELGQLLGIHTESAKDRVEQICQLMGARNRTHAVALGFATGRIALSDSRHKKAA